jgi:hypothetical protein
MSRRIGSTGPFGVVSGRIGGGPRSDLVRALYQVPPARSARGACETAGQTPDERRAAADLERHSPARDEIRNGGEGSSPIHPPEIRPPATDRFSPIRPQTRFQEGKDMTDRPKNGPWLTDHEHDEHAYRRPDCWECWNGRPSRAFVERQQREAQEERLESLDARVRYLEAHRIESPKVTE